jgi:hypothetical protein
MIKLSKQFQNFLLKLNNNVNLDLNASWINKAKPGVVVSPNNSSANKPSQK